MADDITDPVLRERVERYLSSPVTHVLGNPDARTCVIEFGDFECPYCAGAAPVLRELVASSDGQVRLIYRNFPLFEVHPHALTAALAAESATAPGLFWAMHDELFAHQDRLGPEDLRRYAERVGADPALAAGPPAQQFAAPVQADYAQGVADGVRGTPSLFVAGQPYAGRVEIEALRKAAGLRRR